MKVNEHDDLIPDQQEGSEIDVTEHRTFETMDEASAFFARACNRLLNVNDWGNRSGMSGFQLFDGYGKEVHRKAQEGDYIRIDIPGPGAPSGGGYDWVKIEEIASRQQIEDDFLAIKVRPSVKPLSKEASPAHFLQDAATSTFIVRRLQLKVQAEEHGRNEMANTNTENTLDNVRNFLVGGAARLGFSYPQWKLLVKGIMA